MRWKSHVRFGGRAEETDRLKGQHRASVRSNHAAARLALEAGAPLESVTRMLGHSTLAFTHEQYVAPTADQTRAAVSALDRLYAVD